MSTINCWLCMHLNDARHIQCQRCFIDLYPFKIGKITGFVSVVEACESLHAVSSERCALSKPAEFLLVSTVALNTAEYIRNHDPILYEAVSGQFWEEITRSVVGNSHAILNVRDDAKSDDIYDLMFPLLDLIRMHWIHSVMITYMLKWIGDSDLCYEAQSILKTLTDYENHSLTDSANSLFPWQSENVLDVMFERLRKLPRSD